MYTSRWSLQGVILWSLMSGLAVKASEGFLEQAFFFDWNKPGQPVPIPVTEQCESIHIQWSRSAATGPNPIAPYYLQIYTSTFTRPFIISAGNALSYDWPVPFVPGTLYQICMFDKNGNTGGCQDSYTVIPSSSGNTTCANITLPASPLDVESLVVNGPMSQYGWVDQCTDISLIPKNGTPPYTLTVAPSLHPPYNLTGADMSPLNWTVSLTWASQYFVSVVDAVGNSWSYGPLHSGGGGTVDCISGITIPSKKSGISTGIAIGSGVGGLFLGLLLGAIAGFFILRFKKKDTSTDHLLDVSGSQYGSPQAATFDRASTMMSNYRPVSTASPPLHLGPSLSSSNSNSMLINRAGGHNSVQYQVEPFVMPTEDGRLAPQPISPAGGSFPSRPLSSTSEVAPAPSSVPKNQVYILHQDNGRPPVTVFHQEGSQVVELPPRYLEGGSSSGPVASGSRARSPSSDGRSESGRTDGSDFLQQQRKPGQLQQKSSRQSTEKSGPYTINR